MFAFCCLGLLQLFKCRLCFPFLSCLSAVTVRFQADANVSHLSRFDCCCGLFFEPLPAASSWCSSVRRKGVCPKNSQHLGASKHFPCVFAYLYIKFLCQKVDIVWMGSKMLLSVCHISLRVVLNLGTRCFVDLILCFCFCFVLFFGKIP